MIIASIQKDVMAGTLPLEVRAEDGLIVLQRRNIVVATNQTFVSIRQADLWAWELIMAYRLAPGPRCFNPPGGSLGLGTPQTLRHLPFH